MKWLILFTIITFCSCAGIRKASQIKSYISFDNALVHFKAQKADSIDITYTGCGGFLIHQDSAAILLDPYFSNTGPLFFLLFKRLKSDTVVIDNFFINHFGSPKDNKGNVKAILISHSHYDHLADVSSIYERNCSAKSVEIIGGPTTKHILNSKGIGGAVREIKPGLEAQMSGVTLPDWIYIKNNRIRILPIPSEHAPHICGIKLISSKKLDEDLLKYPAKMHEFPEGENYNFIIDILDAAGKIKFRIFSHAGGASKNSIGIPSNDILNEKKIDVLLLCAANFNQVENYPKLVLEKIKSEFIIGNHWENFFRGYSKNLQRPATVPGTNVKRFISKIKQAPGYAAPHDSTRFQLPLPGVTFRFVY